MTPPPLELAERLEAIRTDHLERATVCRGKNLVKRTALHYAAASDLRAAADYIRKAEEGNVARLLRENAVLRAVAASAARLRRIGEAADQIEEGAATIWRENPDMTRSATGMIMAQQAYNTALTDFDRALLNAADVFVRDPFADELALFTRPNPPAKGGET